MVNHSHHPSFSDTVKFSKECRFTVVCVFRLDRFLHLFSAQDYFRVNDNSEIGRQVDIECRNLVVFGAAAVLANFLDGSFMPAAIV